MPRPSARRPAVNAPLTLCTRTLNESNPSAALQVAQQQPYNLTSPASREIIALWASDLELDILIAFGIDPKRYKVRLHDLKPPADDDGHDHVCFEGKEVRSLNYLDLSDAKPVVSGAYEVHFMLRDNVAPPTVEELRAWQRRWAVTASDPAPKPVQTAVTFCQLNKRPMRVDIARLSRPFAGHVESKLRRSLGLLSEKDLFQANFGEVFGVDLTRDEVLFHLHSEPCEAKRDVDDLRTGQLDLAQGVRMHIRPGEDSAMAER